MLKGDKCYEKKRVDKWQMGLVNTCVYVVFQTSSCAPGLQGSFPNGQSSCCHHLLSSYYILALVIRWKADAQNPLLTSGGC